MLVFPSRSLPGVQVFCIRILCELGMRIKASLCAFEKLAENFMPPYTLLKKLWAQYTTLAVLFCVILTVVFVPIVLARKKV